MWLYELPERAHVPGWVNLAHPRIPRKELPLEVRVARAVNAMRANWEAYDMYCGREVNYHFADADTDSDGDWDDASDECTDDPDDEWFRSKNKTF
jgi:hypothetical protein